MVSMRARPLARLGAGILAPTTRLVFFRHRVGDLGAQFLGARLGGVGGSLSKLAGEDHDLVLELGVRPPRRGRATASTVSCLRRSRMTSTLVAFAEEVHMASAVVTPICSPLHSLP